MKRGDERFDEIMVKEVKLKIAEAFLELEAYLRETPCGMKETVGEKSCGLVKEKANQMKMEINNFIDSQVNRIIDQSKHYTKIDSQVVEELEEI